jgi:hypothetical protein
MTWQCDFKVIVGSLVIFLENIVARMHGDDYKMGIGLTTGFIRSHTVTHNYSVYTSQLTIAAATLL